MYLGGHHGVIVIQSSASVLEPINTTSDTSLLIWGMIFFSLPLFNSLKASEQFPFTWLSLSPWVSVTWSLQSL